MIFQIKNAVKKVTPGFVLDAYHLGWAFGGAVRYGFPSKKIKVIGITGTNGKSTTIAMTAAIFKQAGFRVAYSSSVSFEVAGETRKNSLSNSMPGRFSIQRLLAQAVAAKCDYAFIEVTSEGIKQHRHRFIDFAGAVFTNLTPEHIESHGSFEKYRAEKLKLFYLAKGFHVINIDDENAKYFLEAPAQKKYCFTLKDTVLPQGTQATVIRAHDIVSKSDGVDFSVNGMNFSIGIAGKFNAANALAAVGVAMSQGIGLAVCDQALRKFNALPGRMERVLDSPAVFVDYAFTPNALEQVYKDMSAQYKARGAKLICVFGSCGGGRDKWKRPVLGQIAARYCDQIVLTNEDPFDEDPLAIIKTIKEGVVKEGYATANLHEILDRKEAIRHALGLAKPQDVVVLTGKGCEPWIRLEGGKRTSWDEKIVVQELAKQLRSGQSAS
jgi:UDP-N-acetylmuramoyl-L-alanyl-D-glutamate--2,6-diaminopimelate ligase